MLKIILVRRIYLFILFHDRFSSLRFVHVSRFLTLRSRFPAFLDPLRTRAVLSCLPHAFSRPFPPFTVPPKRLFWIFVLVFDRPPCPRIKSPYSLTSAIIHWKAHPHTHTYAHTHTRTITPVTLLLQKHKLSCQPWFSLINDPHPQVRHDLQ